MLGTQEFYIYVYFFLLKRFFGGLWNWQMACKLENLSLIPRTYVKGEKAGVLTCM